MPLQTACREPGCPEIIDGRYCQRHHPLFSQRRTPAKQRGYDSTWRKIRNAHVQAEPTCRECRSQGREREVDEVDHVIPHRKNLTLLRSGWNLQSLCSHCHQRKTAGEPRREVDRRWPLFNDPNRPVRVVCGPPGAGKTTYIEEQADSGDELVDIEHIRSTTPAGSITYLLHQRNKGIASAASVETESTLWVEFMAARFAYRRFWAWNLKADVEIVLETEDVCRARIERRGRNTAALLGACERWFRYWRVEGEGGVQ